MNITNEGQITGPAAKELREKSGQSQKAFWRAYGISQPGGWRYEQGAAIPLAIRRLIFIEHIAGLKFDASTDEGAAEVVRQVQILRANEHVKQAQELLSTMNNGSSNWRVA